MPSCWLNILARQILQPQLSCFLAVCAVGKNNVLFGIQGVSHFPAWRRGSTGDSLHQLLRSQKAWRTYVFTLGSRLLAKRGCFLFSVIMPRFSFCLGSLMLGARVLISYSVLLLACNIWPIPYSALKADLSLA